MIKVNLAVRQSSILIGWVLIRPYIMDLDSTNGTYLNGKRIEPRRYYGKYTFNY